jgi:nucleotide-binding universal stress UspA family protein
MPQQNKNSNTILVAIDGSPASKSSARTGIEIAQRDGMGIRGLYVVDEVLVMDGDINYRGELDEDIKIPAGKDMTGLFEEQGEKALAWLDERCQRANVPYTYDMIFGGVTDVVVRESKEADLLALGRRGRGHADDIDHLGRMFRNIAHRSFAPVLIGGRENRPIHDLLLAYDGSEKSRRALSWARRLQGDLGGRVVALSVAQEGSDSSEWVPKMKGEIESSGLADFTFISRKGEAADEILIAAAENEVDLILVGRYGHSAFVDLFIGSTLDRILRHTRLPVIAA